MKICWLKNGLTRIFFIFENQYFNTMENFSKQPDSGTGLGIAGLVLGIIALPLAMMGCTFMAAMMLAIVGITLSALALSQARRVSAPTSLITAALVLCIIALGFSVLRLSNTFTKIKQLPWELVNKQLDKVENNADEFGRVFEEEFDKELQGDLDSMLKDMEKELQQMEGELDSLHLTIDLNDSTLNEAEKEAAARKLGRATGRAVRVFVEEMNDSLEVHIQK